MDETALLALLLDLVQRLGFEVRRTPLNPRDQEHTARSGACVLRGRRLILLDRAAPPGDQVSALARALRAENLEGIFVPPAVRQLLDDE